MIEFKVNGKPAQSGLSPDTPVMWVLRDELGLTGTKYGCGTGICGACTIHLDGKAARACIVNLQSAAGKSLTTIEGLDAQGMHPAQRAWREHAVPQCGFCQAGQIMQAAAFIADNPRPTEAQITEAMSGNLCRCGCYQRIHAAVKSAAAEQAGKNAALDTGTRVAGETTSGQAA